MNKPLELHRYLEIPTGVTFNLLEIKFTVYLCMELNLLVLNVILRINNISNRLL